MFRIEKFLFISTTGVLTSLTLLFLTKRKLPFGCQHGLGTPPCLRLVFASLTLEPAKVFKNVIVSIFVGLEVAVGLHFLKASSLFAILFNRARSESFLIVLKI